MTFHRSDMTVNDLQGKGTSEGVKKGWLKRKRAIKEFKKPGYGQGKTRLALKLFQAIKEGGFTYDAMHAQSPTVGYSVSMTKDFETVFDAEKITPNDVLDFMNKAREYVVNTKRAHLGGWVDLSKFPVKVYLDVSTVFKDFNKAVQQGEQLGELGIYGLKEFKTYDIQKKSWVEPENKDVARLEDIKWSAAKPQPKTARFKRFMVPWDVAYNDPSGVVKMIRHLAKGGPSKGDSK